MSNIAIALREEVVRLSRREIKQGSAALKKASSQYRRDIAAIKRQVAKLQRICGLLERKILAKPVTPDAGTDTSKLRFSARGLKSHRERLGISAADYGKLAGASSLSVYNWENGKARPRKEQVAKLAALKRISKREAMARLEKLAKRK